MTIDIVSIEPRHFWRRAFAFILDGLLIGIISGLLLVPISMAAGVDLGASSFGKVTTCDAAPPTLPVAVQVDLQWPLAAGEARTNMLCHVSMLGVPGYDVFRTSTASSSKSQGGVVTYTSSRSLGVIVDKGGNLVSVTDYPNLAIPLGVLLFALFTVNGRRTPGKVMLSLRAVTRNGEPFGWAIALRREALKLLPLLLAFMLQVYQFATTYAEAESLGALIQFVRSGAFSVLLLTGPVVVAIWWFGPFFFWSGATWYDRIAGTRVIRTGKR